MFKPCLFIIGLTMAMASGCGKGEEQAKKAESKAQPEAKSKKEPAPASKPPPPAKAAKTPKIKSVAEIKKTPEQEEEDRFLESLRPKHEGKPSTLKIELEKLRAKGEPVTLKELDAWHKAVPPEKNAALAFQRTTNSLPKNSSDLRAAAFTQNMDPMLIKEPVYRAKAQAFLAAHQAHINQLFIIYQRYPGNQPARFRVDWTHGFATKLPHISEVKRAARLLMLRSQFFATHQRAPVAQGQNALNFSDQQQAVSSILVLLRLCHLLDGDPALISALVQFASCNYGRHALETVLNMRILTDAQLVLLQRAFANYNCGQRFSNAIIGERGITLGIEQIFRSGTPPEQARIDPDGPYRLIPNPIRLILKSRPEPMRDREMTTFIAYYNEFLSGLRKGYPDFTDFASDHGAFAKKWNKWTDLIGNRRHKIRYILTNICAQSITKLKDRIHLAVLTQQFAITALAIERYRLANRGQIPGTLRKLMPNYLLAHPFDPFTGKPLIYHDAPNGSYKLLSAKALEDKPTPFAKNEYTFSVDPANRLK